MTRLHPPRWRRHPAPRRRCARGSGEDGFILLESIVAISLITIILAALGTFTLTTVKSTNELRARQAATQIATSAMATISAIAANDLLTARDTASANTQYTRGYAYPTVRPYLDSLARASNGSSTVTGDTAAVSTSTKTTTLNGVVYSYDTYVGTCVIPTSTTTCAGSGGSGVTYDRVVIWVTWQNRGCTNPAGCTFITSTLVSPDDDQVFNTNRAAPSTAPSVAPPGDQRSTVGGAVSLQLAVRSGTGLDPFTWAVSSGSLPLGLTLSTTGLITGSPSAVQVATLLTVTVTDAFGRTDAATFSWAVLAAPTVTTPPSQSNRTGTTANLPIASTCANSPCSFTLSNAPAGLTINAASGVISGTLTTVGTSPNVTVTITDAAGVTATTAAFSWAVTAGPSVTSPGNQALTVGGTGSIAIPYICPTPTCTITLNGGVPGLLLTNPAATTGPTTPETAAKFTTPGAVDTTGTTNLSVGKTATQSTNYNSSSTASRAVDNNTDGNVNNGSVSHTNQEAQPWWQVDLGSASLIRAVKIWNRTDCCGDRLSNFYVFTSPTDMSSKTATQLLADPTVAVQRISGLNGQPNITIPAQSAGRFVRVQLAGLTGVTPNSYLQLAEVQVLGSVDTGNSITVSSTSGTVYATGTVAASAVPAGNTSKVYNPNLSITDVTGVSTATAAGTWTAYTAPTIGAIGSRQVAVQQVVNVPLAYTCPIAQCTLTLPATVQGLGLSSTGGENTANGNATLTVISPSGTVYYSGKVAAGALNGTSTTAMPQVVITDVNAVAAATTGTWTVTPALVVAIPDQTKPRPIGIITYTLNVADFVTPAGTYTYTMTNAQPWLSINSTTGVITARITTLSATSNNIAVTVTPTGNPTAAVTDTFNWTIQ